MKLGYLNIAKTTRFDPTAMYISSFLRFSVLCDVELSFELSQ